MLRNLALFMSLGAAVSGCSQSGITDQSGSSARDSTARAPRVSSLSPNYAFASSSAITVTITGSSFVHRSNLGTWAVWSGDDSTTTALETTVVSDTILKAVVPTSLLLHELGTVQIRVEIGFTDEDQDAPLLASNSVRFTVLPRDPSFSTEPSSAAAGSSDLTITVMGKGFVSDDFLGSFVVLSANGTDTFLTTRFVSSSELTAIVPAPLLKEPLVGLISVVTGYDPGDGMEGRRIGAANFTVTP